MTKLFFATCLHNIIIFDNIGTMQIRVINRGAQKELAGLGVEAQAALDHIVALMQRYGNYALGMPHVRKLQGTPLWEIRLKDARGIARIIFVSVTAGEIIFLHAFRKKTQKTPKQAIELALQRLKEV